MVAVEPLQGIHRKRSLRKEGFFLLHRKRNLMYELLLSVLLC
jgi:hypothetical protein